MIKVEFFSKADRITGFCSEGHSGYGEAGTDIVCAAVSSAVTLTECILNDMLGAGAKVRVDEAAARVRLTLPAKCEEESVVQAVLAGFMATLSDLRDQYPEYLDVTEVEENA